MSTSKPKSFDTRDLYLASNSTRRSAKQRALREFWRLLLEAAQTESREEPLFAIDSRDTTLEVMGFTIDEAGNVAVGLNFHGHVHVPLQTLLDGVGLDVSTVLALTEKLPKPFAKTPSPV